MIDIVADLLQGLRDAEVKKIKQRKMGQSTLKGNVYESTTAKILRYGLFKGLNLKIIKNSFIKNKAGELSKEYDVLIIEGDGIPYPNVDQYDVDIEQVIAVIQVKKTLNPKLLQDAYDNLKSVNDIADIEYKDYHKRMFSDSYNAICDEPAGVDGQLRKEFKSGTSQEVYEILKEEAFLPIRIVLSYQGYMTEDGLRNVFLNNLKKAAESDLTIRLGLTPLNFPSLIICHNLYLTKNNALPYVGNMTNNSWPIYTSATGNPFVPFLELLYTRLCYKYNINPQIFGQDLTIDLVHPLLSVNSVWNNNIKGWYYAEHPLVATPKNLNNVIDWEPLEVDEVQFHIINYLCKFTYLRLHKLSRCQGVPKNGHELVISNLVKTKLVYIHKKKELRLMTKQCKTTLLDNRYLAADDITGRFSRWIKKHYPDAKV